MRIIPVLSKRFLFATLAGLLLLPALSPYLHAQDLTFDKLTTDHGLSHNSVFAIKQDYKGFMWFGTNEGLNRYDGTSVTTYYADRNDSTKLISNHITALEVGPDHLLYIGTPLGLHIYDDQKGIFRRIKYKGNSIGYITKILNAKDGSLYICSSEGLFAARNNASELHHLVRNVNVRSLLEYKRGIFWLSTFHTLVLVNGHGEVIKEYTDVRNEFNQKISLVDNIACLFNDKSGNTWLGSNKNGLLRYDVEKDMFKSTIPKHRFNPLEVNIVRVLSEDRQGNLWIGTESGLFIYRPDIGTFTHYTQSFDGSASTLSDKAIYSIYQSNDGIMWVGTYFGGVNISKPAEKGFEILKPDGGVNQLSGKAISEIIQDKNGKIWIATEDGGVNIWDRKAGSFSYLKNESNQNSLSVNNVHALYEDDHGIFWIGTFLGGLNRYDSKTGDFQVFKQDRNEPYAFVNNMVYAIQKDQNDELWIGTIAGLNKFDPKSGTYELFRPEVFNGTFVYQLYKERSGGMWICMSESDSLYHYEPTTRQFTKYRYYDSAFAPNQGTIAALEDSKGQMWFGTNNRGLVKFDRYTRKFTGYTIRQGLPNNYVYGILEDSKGNLWISTNKGLSRFNPKAETFTNFDISHGLPNNQFNYKSAFKDRDGWMYFGTINGLCYFHPDSLIVNGTAPVTYLSDLKLFNKSVPVGEESVLKNTIDATNTIEIPYADNVITLEFGAIHYYASGNNKYAYYLDGFEKDWNYVQGKNSATYTNLSPGEYVFKVKSANNDGVWSEQMKELKVIILPPFWATSWAMSLYAVFIFGLFMLYRAILKSRNKEKLAIQLERMEREKIDELNQHKLNFFTYISHEFKTPLTLIMASIDKFLQDKPLNDEPSKGYWSIKRSAKRLHFLIEQLMEFRRVETDHARMNYANGDIILFLGDTFQAFSPLFNKKKIDFYFNSNKAAFVTYFDADKLEKIITNLLSNAIKYTAPEGLIEMEVNVKVNLENNEYDSIRIGIYDTGIGMEPDEVKNIFTAFYQTEHGKKSGSGTGIGLALVKSLIDFLGGTIVVESKQQSGTQFTISLPLPRNVNKDHIEFIEGNKTIDVEHVLPLAGQESSEGGNMHETIPQYQLMLVEDSEELMNFLGEHFNKKYKIVKANNGAVALQKIKKSAPDIILTDVMMPEMDGIELCRAVKSDINTSHIPVIFLTAKTTIENKIAGLDEGADAYIAKPFSLKELDLVIQNLLNARSKIQNHFLKFGSVRDMDVVVANRDQDFILKLTQIVEKNIDNAEFNITQFAQEACVSRSLLHLKLKKLVNLSASEFIRNIRLQKAADLLRATDFSVTEIAFKVGYADSNYFSRSFKEKYQVNPSEFKSTGKAGV